MMTITEDEEIRILLLEDAPLDAELITRELKRAGLRFNLRRVDTRQGFMQELEEFAPTLILSDYTLPHFDGMTALQIAQENKPETPFVFVSGTIGEETAVQALTQGAAHYIYKHKLSELGPVMLRLLEDLAQRRARQQAEQALHEREAFYHTILENIVNGVWVTNKNDVINYVNRGMTAFVDIPNEQLVGRSLTQGFWKETPRFLRSLYLEAKTTLQPRHYEAIPALLPSGRSTFQSGWLVPLVREGVFDGIICTVEDVTERKHFEQALQEKNVELENANRAKDCFLSNVSHELRTPLTAIYGFVSILRDGLAGAPNPEQREYLDMALRNVTQLRTMINDLLEVVRISEGKLTVVSRCVSLADLITETLQTFQVSATAKGLHLETDVPGELSPVYADPDRVRQILNNLLDNAIKFSSAGGRITVRTRVSEQNPEFLCTAVTDTGCGINPESTQKIFERLSQDADTLETSRKGLGLGLYICRELVSQHGGDIWVESQLGLGSIFYFTLPIFSPDGNMKE